MKEVLFKYDVDQKVTVKVLEGKIVFGVVTMCAYDRGGVSYYVQMGENGSWWHEDQLKVYE